MAGCFSWCIPRHNNEPKTPTKTEAGAILLNQSEKVVPSKEMYFLAGAKATATTLKSISGFVPVPMVSDLLQLAIRVVEACEAATSIEENVEELRQRVCSLSILIIDKVPPDNNLDQDFQAKIQSLQSILTRIIKDLDEVKRQKKWLLLFFPELNKGRLDRCVGRLDIALESFNLSHQLRMEEILDKILAKNSQVHSAVLDVKDQLDRMEAAMNPHSSPYSVGRQDVPPSPKIFYGRDGDVAAIVDFLSDKDTSRVCITGPGGMGKTRVALAVIHNPTVQQIFGNYRFWVPCIKATSPDLLRRTLYTQLSITAQSYDSLDTLINELRVTGDRRLILLDNFETPWHSGEGLDDQTQISDILSRLAELPHVAVMVTMTSSFPPDSQIHWKHHKLPALQAFAARQAFVKIYPEAASADSAEVDELMNAVGHIPLAITLMAANGKGSQTSTKDLLKEWKTAGTGMIDDMDLRIKISMDLVQAKDRNSEVLKLLAILSMLPDGTTTENLYWWATELTSQSRAVFLLRTAALVEQENRAFGSSHIFLRPTIQAYMYRHDLVSAEVQKQVRDACYKFVLDHKSNTDDLRFKNDLVKLSSEENNIQVLLMQDDNNTESLRPDALVSFSLYLFNTKQSIVVAQLALKVATTAHNHRCIAEAHEILGKMFLRISGYEEACRHFKKARQCFKGLPTGADLPRAGECSFQLANVWQYMQKKSRGLKMRSLVMEAHKDLSHDKDNSYNVARALRGLGVFLWYSRDRDEARRTFTTAKDEFERLGRSASASDCLFYLARTEAREGNYPRALDLSQEALARAEQSGDSYLISQALNTKARCLIALESYDIAESVLQRCLSQVQALGQILGIAQVLELFGYIHAARGDLLTAHYFYTESQAQFDKAESGQQSKTRCASNLQKLATGQTTLVELQKPLLY